MASNLMDHVAVSAQPTEMKIARQDVQAVRNEWIGEVDIKWTSLQRRVGQGNEPRFNLDATSAWRVDQCPRPEFQPPVTPPTVQRPSDDACPKCGGQRDSRHVNVVDTECWSCSEPMKIAFGGATGGPSPHPGDFTDSELAAARQAGAKLEIRFSKTTQSEYLANVCPHCNQITGDFFLHDYWHLASDENEVSATFDCRACDRGLPPLRKPRTRRARKQTVASELVPTAAEPTPPQVDTAPTPRPERKQVWGKCGSCGQSASPIQVTSGTFYCGMCHRTAAFIPDP